MKKYLLVTIIMCLGFLLKAQKVSLGPELGVNIIPMENTNYGYNA